MFGHFTVIDIILIIIAVLISMAVHEAMHAFVGLKLGDDTAAEEGRVSLNPLRHIDPFMTVILPVITILLFGVPILAAKPVPFNPERVRFDDYGAAMIAAAGPLSNLLLAIIGALLFRVAPPDALLQQFISLFVSLNVSLFVFNLVPIPPLDGSRVLYAFAPDAVRRVMEQLEQYGLILVFALVLIGGGRFLDHLIQLVLNVLP